MPRDLPGLCRRAARLWPDRRALRFDESGVEVTFSQLDEMTDRWTTVLSGLGISGGDRLAVMLPNRLEFPLAWLAAAKLGAVMVPVNVNYRTVDAGYVLAHSGSRLLITDRPRLALAEELGSAVPTLELVASVDDTSGGRPNLSRMAAAAAPARPAPVPPETLLNIQYTSGTTGHPKGCTLSHYFWSRMGGNFVWHHPQLGPEDITLTCQPFYYADPQWLLVATLMSGAAMVVLDRFHPSTFWTRVREYEVTFFYCLGMMPAALLKMPSADEDCGHRVRAVFCSAIPAHLHAELEERWGAPWYEVFGMTETGGDVMVGPGEHEKLVGSGSIGRPLPDREVRIVDEDDRSVSRGEVGEMVLRGPGLLDGYYRDEEATRLAFRGGWFHTGDLCRMAEDGLIYFVGRHKDMIRRSGENIASAEVEDVLRLHPDVLEAACLPVADELRGEEVKAYVVLRSGTAGVGADQLAEFCAERLAAFKVPRYWEFRGELPRTPSERVAKGRLRGEHADLRTGAYDRVEGRVHAAADSEGSDGASWG